MLLSKPKGVLCDISGVLKDGVDGTDEAIAGSVKAFDTLQASGIPFVLCTNESSYSPLEMSEKLGKIGFQISPDRILSPISAVVQTLKDGNHRPYLLVNKRVVKEFNQFDQENPDAVVVGDAEDGFNYKTMNEAFNILIKGNCKFFSLGKSKFFLDSGALKLDVGCWVTGLEYSSQQKAEIIGKPSAAFFDQGARMIGLPPSKVVMIGDDIESDVGGALSAGFQGILVRTGKFRPQDEQHPTVKPTLIVDDFQHAVNAIINS